MTRGEQKNPINRLNRKKQKQLTKRTEPRKKTN